MKLGKNSYIGIGLIIVALILAMVVGYFRAVIIQLQRAEMGGSCPMENNIPPEIVIGYAIAVAIGAIGLYITISDLRSARFRTQSAQDWGKKASSLAGDERKLYDMVAQSDGVMFQSDIVEKSGMQKVKVSRVLDKMEARGIIERRRRGMSNVVMLRKP
jgi:uncharacterized membrane protein